MNQSVETKGTGNPPAWKKAFAAGVGMGLAVLALSFTLRIFNHGVFLPEQGVQLLVSLTSGSLESYLIGQLGGYAKQAAFYGGVVVNLLVYGVLGIALGRVQRRLENHGVGMRAAVGSLISFVVFALLLVLLVRGRIFEAYGLPSVDILLLFLLFSSAIYATGLTLLLSKTQGSPLLSEGKILGMAGMKKRMLVTRILPSLALIATFAYGAESLLQSLSKAKAPAEPGGQRLQRFLDSVVTPNNLFYVVSKNAIDPDVEEKTWTLTVEGLVSQKLTLRYEDLKNFESVSQHATLECISNRVGGDLISNAEWKGLPFTALFTLAGLKIGSKHVVFHSADGYSVSVPIEKVLQKGSILAYEMNGEKLSDPHGFPLRAIVPGLYGMMNPKWITKITLSEKPHIGYWQERGWSQTGVVLTTSFFRIPEHSESMKGENTLAGFAYSGDRGISRVEVSLDEGKTWKEAELRKALSPYTWVPWALDWKTARKGTHRLLVRAYEGDGRPQISDDSDGEFPEGATGYHFVGVTVA